MKQNKQELRNHSKYTVNEKLGFLMFCIGGAMVAAYSIFWATLFPYELVWGGIACCYLIGGAWVSTWIPKKVR